MMTAVEEVKSLVSGGKLVELRFNVLFYFVKKPSGFSDLN